MAEVTSHKAWHRTATQDFGGYWAKLWAGEVQEAGPFERGSIRKQVDNIPEV